MSLQPPKSTARMYFEQIKAKDNPFSFLSNIPSKIDSDPFFEDEWIDFKGEPQSDKDTKKIWSKALSGFANITDGLLIWGIDARKTEPRGIDAACGLRLISDPSALESKLREWVRDATNPPVIDVEYQTYSNDTGKGFILCLIPESRHKPHRAEFANKQYYYRASDNFLIAGASLLRMLFYPQSNPYLWVKVSLGYELNPSDLGREYRNDPNTNAYNTLVNKTSSMSFDVLLRNTGTSTAKDMYVVVQASHLLNYYQGADWDIRKNLEGIAFQARRPIHPGEVTELFSASFQDQFHNTSPPGSWEIKPHFDKTYLHFNIYAESLQKQELEVEFTPDDLNFESGFASKKGLPKI